MIANINNEFKVDLSKPIDISIPITNTEENPIAWYIEKPVIEPVVFGEWIGSIKDGASTNFNNISFNPHGHGTHTECLGHITREFHSINQSLKQFFFLAELISIVPEMKGEDLVISRNQVKIALGLKTPEAIVIRTLPNFKIKKSLNYSNTNPPYLAEDAALFIRENGIKHLLIDLPSVDKEHDEGKLLAHKAFWNVKDVNNLNASARLDCTITEMIYVPEEVEDGSYLLNLQIASFENDASPSKPILYQPLTINGQIEI
ncbi:cyclase family protein [Flavobacterium laiguense]|uniref:Metal-dependent hydrolase n=1 Tax=Flavobacterium laiguense TaxID=2169409 RepID=A0A2U1K177_9FLAO|nr:cyclase family protein [Flavobacterium laiguense]PWA11280.1 metal-dependent hydrolase [Flavobacterium laiguense]